MKDILIFYDENFPFEGSRPDEKMLSEIQMFSDLAGVDDLDIKLNNGDYKCLILLHGQYFPENSWSSIIKYINLGNGFICCGGPAFSMPLKHTGNGFEVENPDTQYYKELNIHHFEKISRSKIFSYDENYKFPFAAGIKDVVRDSSVYQVIFNVKDSEIYEDAAESDIVIDGLEFGFSADGYKICSPVVAVENSKVKLNNSRWILINQVINNLFWDNGGCGLLKRLGEWCTKGSAEFTINPAYYLYYKNEQPCILIQCQGRKLDNKYINIQVKVTKDDIAVSEYSIKFNSAKTGEYISVPLDFQVDTGFYEMSCTIYINDEMECIINSGFWGFDKEVLAVKNESANNAQLCEYIIGVKYYTERSINELCISSNPYRWYRDFRLLHDAGINTINLKILPSAKKNIIENYMLTEEIMRAVDSFLLCAMECELHVLFDVTVPVSNRDVGLLVKYFSQFLSRCCVKENILWNLIYAYSENEECRKNKQVILNLLDSFYGKKSYVLSSPINSRDLEIFCLNGIIGSYEKYAFFKKFETPFAIDTGGVKYNENINGIDCFGELKQRNMLEKSLAYSLTAGAEGIICSLHDSMVNNDFYSGCIRNDGTEKPQFTLIRKYARYIRNINYLMSDRIEEQIVIVKTSNTEISDMALKQAIKLLSYDIKANARIIQDCDTESLENARVMFVPSQGYIDEDTWSMLYDKISDGAVLLVTGPINYLPRGRKTDRLLKFTGDTCYRLLPLEDELMIGDTSYRVSYDEEIANFQGQEIPVKDQRSRVNVFNIGSGKVIWCPASVELNKNLKVIGDLYRFVLRDAKVQRDFLWKKGRGPGIFARKIIFKEGYIMVFISEMNVDRELEVIDRSTQMMLSFILPADRVRMLAFDNNNKLIDSYNPQHIMIKDN